VSPSPPPPPPTSGPHIVTVALKSQQTTGLIRYALPILLITGGLAALGGASSLVVSMAGSGIMPALRRFRRLRFIIIRRTP
jgi:hypothetical protein